MWDHSDDPQFDREAKQEAQERHERDYGALDEHDSIHGENNEAAMTKVPSSPHTDVHRIDGGGTAHAAARVAHAHQTKATYGDHSPRGGVPPALPGQVHGQGVLPLIWPDKRTSDQKHADMKDMRREHDEDNRREWYE